MVRAVRLTESGLQLEQIDTPEPGAGDALVRVRAAAITKDELEWPVDRLPAIPSYELSGEVAALGPDANGVAVGDEVYALADFGRDGAAAQTSPSSRPRCSHPGRARSTTSRAPRSRSQPSAHGRACSTTDASKRASAS
jgi:D-arabinose 1-dehydrogenase-like Zn-dependent alcohol dehydrogenase